MSQDEPQQPYAQTPPPPPPPASAEQAPGQPVYGQPVYGLPASQRAGTMSQSDERLWGVLAHLSWILGSIVAIAPLGPLVVFLVLKERSPFVRRASVEALNLWITVYIVMAVSIPLMFVLVGFITFALAGLFGLVTSILAAVAANRGEEYRTPFILRLVS